MTSRLTPRLARATPLLLALSLGVAGCSGGETASPPEATEATAGSGAPSAAPTGGRPNGELVLGGLLPLTGSSSELAASEVAGMNLAIADINAAGGVLAKPVRFVTVDSGDTADNAAPGAVDRLLDEQSDAILGAASSSVTLTVLDKVTASGVLQVSPSATSQELSSVEDRDLFFRTAPSNRVQAGVLANEIAGDGNERLGVLASDDSYGQGLADRAQEVFEQNGGDVPEKILFAPGLDSYAGEVAKLRAANLDSVAVLSPSSGDTTKLMQELVAQGLGPDKRKTYFADGSLIDDYALAKGTLRGVKGSLPGARPPLAFQKRLQGQDPSLAHFSYAPESYDAAVLVALAAEKAQTDASGRIAAELVGVSRDGEKCRDYAACKRLLADGKDIDYDGISGPISFNAEGDPAEAFIGIYSYGATNRRAFLKAVLGKLD